MHQGAIGLLEQLLGPVRRHWPYWLDVLPGGLDLRRRQPLLLAMRRRRFCFDHNNNFGPTNGYINDSDHDLCLYSYNDDFERAHEHCVLQAEQQHK